MRPSGTVVKNLPADAGDAPILSQRNHCALLKPHVEFISLTLLHCMKVKSEKYSSSTPQLSPLLALSLRAFSPPPKKRNLYLRKSQALLADSPHPQTWRRKSREDKKGSESENYHG